MPDAFDGKFGKNGEIIFCEHFYFLVQLVNLMWKNLNVERMIFLYYSADILTTATEAKKRILTIFGHRVATLNLHLLPVQPICCLRPPKTKRKEIMYILSIDLFHIWKLQFFNFSTCQEKAECWVPEWTSCCAQLNQLWPAECALFRGSSGNNLIRRIFQFVRMSLSNR